MRGLPYVLFEVRQDLLATEADIAAWADTVAVNPARIPPGYADAAGLDRVRERLAASTAPGLEALTRLMAVG